MSLVTFEVALDHGRVIPTDGETLPLHGKALLTLLPQGFTIERHPVEPKLAARGEFFENPTAPLSEDEWPEELR